jgi:hypothetical protein
MPKVVPQVNSFPKEVLLEEPSLLDLEFTMPSENFSILNLSLKRSACLRA